MKAHLIILVVMLLHSNLFSQIGVKTDAPEATLDVRAENHLGTVTSKDGVLVPRVNSLVNPGSVNGQLVYLIADTVSPAFTKGFHYWDGAIWKPFAGTGDPTIDAWIDNTVDNRLELTLPNGAPRPVAQQVMIDPNGNVGIKALPDINNALNINGTAFIKDGITVGENGVGSSVIGKGNSNEAGYLAIFHPNGTEIGHFGGYLNTGDMYYSSFGNNRFNSPIIPDQDGLQSIGLPNMRWGNFYSIDAIIYNETVQNNLAVGNNIVATNNIYALNFVQTSDGRLKKDIKNTGYGLSSVMKMRPVEYNWKDGSGKHRVGFIAQEMEKIVPESVEINSDGRYGMNYTELIPVLTKAIQEQQEQIEELKLEVKSLYTKKREANQ